MFSVQLSTVCGHFYSPIRLYSVLRLCESDVPMINNDGLFTWSGWFRACDAGPWLLSLGRIFFERPIERGAVQLTCSNPNRNSRLPSEWTRKADGLAMLVLSVSVARHTIREKYKNTTINGHIPVFQHAQAENNSKEKIFNHQREKESQTRSSSFQQHSRAIWLGLSLTHLAYLISRKQRDGRYWGEKIFSFSSLFFDMTVGNWKRWLKMSCKS